MRFNNNYFYIDAVTKIVPFIGLSDGRKHTHTHTHTHTPTYLPFSSNKPAYISITHIKGVLSLYHSSFLFLFFLFSSSCSLSCSSLILHGVDPLRYFSFQPVLHDWCNKRRGMCYPVCGMVHIKEPLLLIDKSSLCGDSGFPFSLSEWSLTICLTPYNRR